MISASTYQQVHRALRRARGPARSYRCLQCDRQAAHWAFDDTKAKVQVDARRRRFSTDLAAYIPLCAKCHGRFDLDPAWAELRKAVTASPCSWCGVGVGELCRTPSGIVYSDPGCQHAVRHNIQNICELRMQEWKEARS